MKKEPVLVPENETGASSHTEHSITKPSEAEAKKLYNIAKQRLLFVSHWHELCGAGSAHFTLTDELGNEIERPARLGDHFKIDIHAPGNSIGEGSDWVQVEAIEDKNSEMEDTEIISIRVRPVDNPKEPTREDIAHFFSNEASSTFTIRRDKTTIIASVHGRNEKPNTESGLIDKIRNTVIAAGAMLGFNKPQWKSLVEGLLADDN